MSPGSGWFRLICVFIQFYLIFGLGRYDDLLRDYFVKYVSALSIQTLVKNLNNFCKALSVFGTHGWNVPFSKFNPRLTQVR